MGRPSPLRAVRGARARFGRLEVREHLGDFLARLRHLRLGRRGAVALGVVGVLFVALVVLPTRSWAAQRTQISSAERELATLRASNTKLDERIKHLGDDATIERQAREQYGFVMPGEESYSVPAAPVAKVTLPDGWPYNRLEKALQDAVTRRASQPRDFGN
jgi:cell division protein FtsB